MRLYPVPFIRLILVCLAMVTGLLFSSPALAKSTVDVPQSLILTTPNKPLGSAKDLLGNDGKPIVQKVNAVKAPGLDPNRLKQTAEAINKSLEQTLTPKPTQPSDRLQIELKNLKSKSPSKTQGLPVSDR